MEGQLRLQTGAKSGTRTMRFWLGGIALVVAAASVIGWLALRHNTPSGGSTKSGATAVSIAQIRTLAASVRHPVFWVGPKAGSTYELTRTLSGTIFIRYLPSGAKVGSKQPYLTVVTYPFPGAYAAIQSAARSEGSVAFGVPHHGRAEYAHSYPQSVHVAYPGVDYQVEVYAPKGGEARALVRSGRLTAFGSLRPSSVAAAPQAQAASVPELQTLQKSLKHPIYWAGPKNGYTYEVTRNASGSVFIRYLPAGVKVGSAKPYLTVATYPYPAAFGAIKALAKQSPKQAVNLAGGGIAVIDNGNPMHIHLAFPGSDYQVEVYDPSAAAARAVVGAGEVSTVG